MSTEYSALSSEHFQKSQLQNIHEIGTEHSDFRHGFFTYITWVFTYMSPKMIIKNTYHQIQLLFPTSGTLAHLSDNKTANWEVVSQDPAQMGQCLNSVL